MLSSRILLSIVIASALELVACSSIPLSDSKQQTLISARSRINRREGASKQISTVKLAANALPSPKPQQLIGDYYDSIDDLLDDTSDESHVKGDSKSHITQRNILRDCNYLKSVWFDGKDHYNISISRDVHFNQSIGKWTNLDGTTKNNATLLDIRHDTVTDLSNTTELLTHLNSRILANAQLAELESEEFLGSTVCNYNPPTVAHDEFRKLQSSDAIQKFDTKFMAMDGYWTSVLISMGAAGTVGGSLYKGFYNRNASAENVAIVCFTAAGLIFTRGIIERLYMNGVLHRIEASVISAFISWFRQALELGQSLSQENTQRVGSDQLDSGCLEEIVVESGFEGLSRTSEPGAGIIELIPMGRC